MTQAQGDRPAAATATKPNNYGQVTPVPVAPKRKVTYVFVVGSTSSALMMPYAVSVNGKVLPAFKDKPRKVACGGGDKIELFVDQGDSVSLYLNSDAHPSHRKHSVYKVVAGDRDVLVKVTEKSGKHSDPDTPVRQIAPNAKEDAERKTDIYAAPLTGDIWMRISHVYSPGEVDALVPAGTSAAVLAAVKSIYAVLPSAELLVSEAPTGGGPGRRLSVRFIDSNNPRQNITAYDLLKDGLTRVHPGGFAALLNAAFDNGIESLRVTSCWRPMLGSIAHRAGLGLDVDYIGNAWINRQELREGKAGGKDSPHVSDEEVKRFKEYERSTEVLKEARKNFVVARKAAEAKGLTAEEKVAAAEQLRIAREAQSSAQIAQQESRRLWIAERDANEPISVNRYRASLLRCSCVAQLFDPWVLDLNTDDNVAPQNNLQKGSSTSLERLHAHHLHITVREPKIL